MTKEEKWIVQGRTREQHREAKTTVAALRIDITSYAERLHEASEHLLTFVKTPSGIAGPTGMTPAQYIAHFFRDLLTAEIERKIGELAEQSDRLQKLEKEIAGFE